MFFKGLIFFLVLIEIFSRAFTMEACADDIFDVEHARALERSKMPLSENNLWYLERWGGITDAPPKGTLGIGSQKENTKSNKDKIYSRKTIKGLQ